MFDYVIICTAKFYYILLDSIFRRRPTNEDIKYELLRMIIGDSFGEQYENAKELWETLWCTQRGDVSDCVVVCRGREHRLRVLCGQVPRLYHSQYAPG